MAGQETDLNSENKKHKVARVVNVRLIPDLVNEKILRKTKDKFWQPQEKKENKC